MCGREMTRTRILAAAAVVLSVVLVAGRATFRDSRFDAPRSPVDDDLDEPAIKKGDRLPLHASTPFPVVSTQSETTPAAPREQLAPATEDDLRQAEAEHHHHHRDVCPKGRTYFTIDHHQYWRCKP